MTRCFYIVFSVVILSSIGLYAQDIQKTTVINNKHFTARLDTAGFYIYGSNSDTILIIITKDFVNFEFNDFNKDGYKDIFLDWGGNVSNRFSLYLYIPSQSKYREIKNFSEFPNAEPVDGTKYYYSYRSAGCADNAWYSNLFYIKDYTAIKIGTIYGEGCGIKDRIEISKVKQGEKILIKTLPLNTIERYKEHKWGFIKQYWMKNYWDFLSPDASPAALQ